MENDNSINRSEDENIQMNLLSQKVSDDQQTTVTIPSNDDHITGETIPRTDFMENNNLINSSEEEEIQMPLLSQEASNDQQTTVTIPSNDENHIPGETIPRTDFMENNNSKTSSEEEEIQMPLLSQEASNDQQTTVTIPSNDENHIPGETIPRDESCVQHLLDSAACSNNTIPENECSRLMNAIREDDEDTVNSLLAESNIVLPDNILLELQMQYEMDNERIDKYMRFILEYLEKLGRNNINNYLTASDFSGRTALHYAALHKSSTDNTVKLIELGASLTKKDEKGNTPLHEIYPTVLGKIFDNCIKVPKAVQGTSNMLSNTLEIYKDQFYVEINYDALLPENENTQVPELELLHYLVKIKKLRCLLIHPVILCYLAIKEQKTRWLLACLNLFIYYVAFLLFSFYPSTMENNSPITANILIGIALLIVFFRGVVRFSISCLGYFKKVENYIDLCLIFDMIYVIIAGWGNTKPIETTSENQGLLISMVIGSVVFILAINLQMKYFPFAAVQITALKNISKWFFIYMIVYLFPLVFCFRLLTSYSSPKASDNSLGTNIHNSSAKASNNSLETDIHNSSAKASDNSLETDIYNIISIFAGDPSSSEADRFLSNSVISLIISIFFIVFIGIILQNLLIALTVSDLQKFKEEAEITNFKEKANSVVNLERLFKNACHRLMKAYKVFGNDRILVFHFNKNGIVRLKGRPQDLVLICNKRIVDFFQDFIKNSSLNNGEDVQHSLNVMSDRLQRIENLLERLNASDISY